MTDGPSFLGVALGIMCLGLMFGVPNLDTLLIDFTAIQKPASRLIQLGFFALALFCFTEV